jgi:GT2 family glycosyltransferase
LYRNQIDKNDLPENYPYKISIVIVNYNVEFFLEQCLNSVKKALKNVNGEAFVVDNFSIDGSVEMVRQKFPEYHLIDNKVNLGFSKANNQAMKIAKGEYVLLLNPDTVVEEDCFQKVVQFMDDHKDAGGLGVKMVDGKGRFLPESKRGLPTPAVAFWKISGLASLFPKSKIFGKYHLGFLDENETHEIEIISGAFMLMRKTALDKVGLLDEAFFMYGEDIDLSYRITKGGFKNYYFPETSIIHYKGESTKKSSVNYVLVFYKAMVIFAKKHFSQKNAKLLSFFIYSAIYLRAGLAIFARLIKKIMLPFVDAIIIYGGLFALTNYWKMSNIEFPEFTFQIALPLYTLVWLINMYYQGNYDKPFKFINSIKGLAIGTLILLVAYALLPKDYQFSRLFILIGAAWTLFYIVLSRLFMHLFFGPSFSLSKVKNKSFAIVGSIDETERVEKLLKQTNPNQINIFRVSADKERHENQIGTIEQLDQISYINKIDEIIFCAKDCSANNIIEWMKRLEGDQLDFKIAQPETIFLIGSNSIDTAGDLYLMQVNKIEEPKNKRLKRLFDTITSILMLVFSPILIWKYQNKGTWLKNLLLVLWGKFSIVGYYTKNTAPNNILPKIKYGILSPSDEPNINSDSQVDKRNLLYARDYSVSKDIKILKSCWGKLDKPLK